MNKKGFTILEIVIVVIIVGLLASLALPRLFPVVESARQIEALHSIHYIREALDRCYQSTLDYSQCKFNSDPGNETTISIDDPSNSVNTHFTYKKNQLGTKDAYEIIATRNSYENGNAGDEIIFRLSDSGIVISGTGAFSKIK